jgi:hypothetical protein
MKLHFFYILVPDNCFLKRENLWKVRRTSSATFKQIKLKPGLKRPKHRSLNFIFKSQKYRPTLQAQDLGRWAWCSLPSFYTHTFGKPCFYIYIYIYIYIRHVFLKIWRINRKGVLAKKTCFLSLEFNHFNEYLFELLWIFYSNNHIVNKKNS